jgi:hypothetical protein
LRTVYRGCRRQEVVTWKGFIAIRDEAGRRDALDRPYDAKFRIT